MKILITADEETICNDDDVTLMVYGYIKQPELKMEQAISLLKEVIGTENYNAIEKGTMN